MDHAGLNRSLGPGRLDRLRQASEPVTAHDQHILDAPVGKLDAHEPPFKEAPSPACTQIPRTCLTPSTPRPDRDMG